jgi:hypothetical protein
MIKLSIIIVSSVKMEHPSITAIESGIFSLN